MFIDLISIMHNDVGIIFVLDDYLNIYFVFFSNIVFEGGGEVIV